MTSHSKTCTTRNAGGVYFPDKSWVATEQEIDRLGWLVVDDETTAIAIPQQPVTSTPETRENLGMHLS